MKKFRHFRGVNDLKPLLEKAGLQLDDEKYSQGWDHVRVEGKVEGRKISLLYSVFNGNFFGYADGKAFSSSQNLDGEPWFDALLNLFYVAD